MNRSITIAAAVLLALAPAFAQAAPPAAKHKPKKPAARKPATPEAQAQQAARAWLALADAGKYDDTWDAAASAFQAAVTKEQWASAVSAARGPLGKVQTRTLQSAKYVNSPPGAPAGEYVIVTYATTFAARAATETAAMTRERDGKWKTSGYFVK